MFHLSSAMHNLHATPNPTRVYRHPSQQPREPDQTKPDCLGCGEVINGENFSSGKDWLCKICESARKANCLIGAEPVEQPPEKFAEPKVGPVGAAMVRAALAANSVKIPEPPPEKLQEAAAKQKVGRWERDVKSDLSARTQFMKDHLCQPLPAPEPAAILRDNSLCLKFAKGTRTWSEVVFRAACRVLNELHISVNHGAQLRRVDGKMAYGATNALAAIGEWAVKRVQEEEFRGKPALPDNERCWEIACYLMPVARAAGYAYSEVQTVWSNTLERGGFLEEHFLKYPTSESLGLGF